MEAWFGLIGFVVGSIITIIIFRIERKDRLKLSHQERKDKFKLVAIEKRLEAHQQALKHWNELREIIHEKDSNRNKVIWAATDFGIITVCIWKKVQGKNLKTLFF